MSTILPIALTAEERGTPATVALRVFDLVLAAATITLTSPVMAVRAAIARNRGGRVLERRSRIGRQGKPFELLEFAGHGHGRSLATLFNVVRGDISWTGPRPMAADEAAALTATVAAERASVLPGLVSRYAVRDRMGIAYDCETDDDLDFLRNAGLATRLALLGRAALASTTSRRRKLVAAPAELTMGGIRVANTNLEEAVDWITTRAAAARRTDVAFVNPHCMNIAHGNENYRGVLQSADRVFPDGIGIRVATRLRGYELESNVNGTDMFPVLAERAAAEGLSVYLLGAAPTVAATTAAVMTARFPGLRIAGTRDGFFSEAEEAAVIDEINRSGASILLVAMGVPRQEMWLARHRERITIPVRIGVGGLFDFYSGRIPRAPHWLRELGGEWCWRLWQEPRRMWKRYLLGNAVFLMHAWAEARAEKREPNEVEILAAWQVSPFQRSLRIAGIHASRQLRRTVLALARAAKRGLDILAAAAAMVVLSPLLVATMIAIRLDSPGAIFFRQTRVGRGGREFRMFKFRSMYLDAEARMAALEAENEMAGGVIFKMRNDPRVTRVGRVIRRLSIDELPQLWNVLAGDMTLVGPRPPLPSEVARYSPADRRRLEGDQGITCIWQVSGRSEIPFPQQVRMDVDYIESQSLWLDIKLLLRTIPAVLGARGAY